MTLHAPLIIDIAGLSLSKKDKQRLKHPLVGGMILFTRNWQSRDQLTALCRSIKKVRKDLLICVDHEGGHVQRFKTDGFTHLPPMRALGELWLQDSKAGEGSGALRATRAATACGYVLGAELRACGVDLSFTPVLDLDFGESSVIGNRAFARDPRVVSLLAKSLMHGLLQSGMANCGKHFPGHGFVKADSHTEIPVDKRSLKAILADDAQPYDWLGTSLTSVMPAHVIYPKVDARPAGFSSKWLGDILRGQLRFNGAVFSDDLSMAGARMLDGQPVSPTQAAVAALNAGCDMVLLCNQSMGEGAELDALINGLTEAQLKGLWQPSDASEERRLALLPVGHATPWDDLMVQSAYMQALDLLP
ncbi:beta-N-acetylhexosaminidase [Rhodoferax sp.]|uniref:beta-N-acetylhexosaminidase n=1 Tax=Rhodoferax sp. TaxID=50421 RepID=UPI002733508D|nr:beta-N-acetylhexosaminidase [Rhodoferax sp.]MDP3192044.1 beta-N-acetylhexosaminidase [Rhodoferax sp.]MDP3338240.1 beta-N-acetylhexosaminidase [Rhodoferax sp.]MDP3865877.1 beta-N-acetylhexosaminidase [Rhodoferax sp.]